MTVKLGVVMDPIGSINVKKDSTLAMLLAAQARGHELHYMEMADLYLRDGVAHGRRRRLVVKDDPQSWFTLSAEPVDAPLASLDVILMRKDPPFDTEYIYATYMLERAEEDGALVVNRPRSLRDANEKMFTAWFPQCCAPTLVARDRGRIKAFLEEHGDIVVKPLEGMGGSSVFRVTSGHPNVNVILETLTNHGRRYAMAQRYLPQIVHGDKRVLVVDGEPIPYCLARVPAGDDARGNLAAGAKGVAQPLSERDRWIAEQVGPSLRERGLIFVGLDVIGDHLTEINVTSPTCIREIEAAFPIDIGGALMDAIQRRLDARE
ncbi:MAG: glutathione synthase [Ectothiorhodospiraceae bacterium]|nr:glutathione synthase [Chromatiales bacterium]MCP5157309.1 glutathione synthase [Ectothiorhodospiraceae bacterium]